MGDGARANGQAARPSRPRTRIGMLWIGGALSYLEILCIRSFLDAGHAVVLYRYGAVDNVPDGVELRDAADILPGPPFLVHERTGSPAPHADRFRYLMLAREAGTIWADTDAYCVRAFETASGHFHGWESAHHVNNGVLGLPGDSRALALLLEATADPCAVPAWLAPRQRAALEAAAAEGQPLHAGQMPWGVWGPLALTHALKETGEIRFSFELPVLYPVSFKERRRLLRPDDDLSDAITGATLSVHLYGRRMRGRLRAAHDGIPPPRSWLGRALRRHGIDPHLFPLPTPRAAPDATDAQVQPR